MNSAIESFLARAKAGHAVYISDVRRTFQAMPRSQTFRFGLNLTLPDGEHRVFVLAVPRFPVDGAAAAETAFVREYFLAELYNRLSALGPRALELRAEPGIPEAVWLHRQFEAAFGLAQERKDRRGYGRALNVLERMVDSLDHTAGSRMICRFTLGPVEDGPLAPRAAKGAVLALGKRALNGVAGRTLLGIDVGGSDIKLALSIDGRLASLKEYDWFPARFTRISSLTDPIEALVKETLDAARSLMQQGDFKLDGIGLSFPDVVVKDKIVGGEVYKTRGIRDNPTLDYEPEFRTLTDLDLRLKPYLKEGGLVATVNDGPMAAFTALVEGSLADPKSVEDGIFAHTLGTELGTGWVTEQGVIPDIPLEVYNFIIDLGSYPERVYSRDDPRSVNNFNTNLPGTLQKYTSQSGAFRLALRDFPAERPDLMKEILEKGFVVLGTGGSLRIPTEPRDMRKPFLEYLMGLPDRGQASANRIFQEIGEFLAVATLECDQILRPSAHARILFGRMVKNSTCFRLMQEGARNIDSAITLVQAADDLAVSKLMRELKADPDHTVAQFAQAVGAVYYVASRLPER